MYRNSNGFSLAESLIAFSCFMVIMAFFLPFCLRMMVTLQEKQQRVEALKFLQEGMEQAIVTNEFESRTRMFENIVYTFRWEGEGSENACVSYTKGGDSHEICASE
jgi:Tfp pilus assembly protein PilV